MKWTPHRGGRFPASRYPKTWKRCRPKSTSCKSGWILSSECSPRPKTVARCPGEIDMRFAVTLMLFVVAGVARASAQQYHADPSAGEQKSSNIQVVGHLGLDATGP